MKKLIELLATHKSYPVNLAMIIGIEEAVAINEILGLCNLNAALVSDVEPRLRKAGIKKPSDMLFSLAKIGILEYNNLEETVKINTRWFEEQDDDLNIVVDRKHIELFSNLMFQASFKKWRSILLAKGSKKTEKELLSLFEGKSLTTALKALEYSIHNKYTSLYFNEREENNRRDSKEDRNNARPGAYGRAGKGDGEVGDRDREEKPTVRKGFTSIEG
jgi:hypothetical protein